MKKYPYLIIGNSAGAAGAVESIRTIDKERPIGIISEEKYHIYSRPRISDCISKGTGPETIVYRPTDYYEKNNVTAILGAKAVSIDTQKKTVTLENGETVGFDRLLLSTGANPAKPPIPGIDLPGVHFFVTWDQAARVAEELDKFDQVVVIGGGLIGMQAAEALSKAGKDVTVVEMLDRVLALAIDQHASEMIEAKFREHGVKILTSSRVSRIEGDGANGPTAVVLSDETRLPCQAVVVATGVTPRTELAKAAGIAMNKGIKVDDYMQTSAPDVYAAGDVAEARDLLSGECRLIPIWPNAYMEGRTAGSAMAGKPVPYSGGLSMNAAHFFDFPVIAAGLTELCDGCTEMVERNDHTGFYRRIILKNNVPLGMIMAGDAVDRGGLVLNLIRTATDCTQFLDKLARADFNSASLPEEQRKTKQLGREKI